jgi:RND family efflux transporter MFP subunit
MMPKRFVAARRALTFVTAGCGLMLVAGWRCDGAAAEARDILCLIEAHRIVKLAAPVAGVLAEVNVDRGDTVTTGMLLAHLDWGVEQAELAAARVRAQDESTVKGKDARHEFTAMKLRRLEHLRQSSQYVSQTALDEADADDRQAGADAAFARVALQLNRIDEGRALAKLQQRMMVSSLSGIVTERNLSAGEYAYEQAPVLTVAELDPLNVELYLPVAQYGSLRLGQTLEVRPEPPISGTYLAKISIIDTLLDARSATFGVRAILPNDGLKLPAGIRCQARPAPEDQGKRGEDG